MSDTVIVVPDNEDNGDSSTVADVLAAHDLGVIEANVEHVDEAVEELTETVEELTEVVEQLLEQPTTVVVVAEPEAVEEVIEEVVDAVEPEEVRVEITPREASHPYTRPYSEWRGKRD